MMYKCLKCGKDVDDEDIAKRIRCPYCGYRILKKKRPKGTIKKVKAR
ncbi:MAG: DNA-directed RNA polymerase subunit P [Candidatus Aenigmatarchaeota archaeon]